MPTTPFAPVWVKRFGTWYHIRATDLYKLHDAGTGGHKQAIQLYRKKSTGWEQEGDLAQPTDYVPVTAFALSASGITAGKAAKITWTIDTTTTDTDYNCNVELLWYNDHVSGVHRTDLVDQNVGTKVGPQGAAGDVVYCSYRYKSKSTNAYGPQFSTSTVTLTAGVVRD